MKRMLLMLVFLTPAPAHAQKIVFPPDRLPLPAVGATKLMPDTLYVVQNPDEKLTYLLLTSPDSGVLSVVEKSGKVSIFAKFHDSDGQLVWREYTGKQIWIVQAKARGEAELLFVPHGTPAAKDVVRKTIAVEMGQAPQPPPKDAPKNPTKDITFVFTEDGPSKAIASDKELTKWLTDRGIGITRLPVGHPELTKAGFDVPIKLAGGAPCVVLQGADRRVIYQAEMISVEQVRKLVEWTLQ